MSEFKIVEDDEMVGICCKGRESVLDSFIDVYINDEISPSPFKTTKEAKMFAEIIVKLLESVMK